MKKNTILYAVLTIAVLAIVGGVVVLWQSGVQAERYYSERLGERDGVIASLRSEIAGLQSEKFVFESRLGYEVAAKISAQENLKTLNWQFKDATRESMRVEAGLTERLNKATAEAEGLKARVSEELNSKTIVFDELRRTQDRLNTENTSRLATIDLLSAERADNKKLYGYLSASVSERDDMVARLDIAKKLVENVLIQETRPAAIKTGKEVKTVIFFPADIKVSITDVDQYKTAVNRSLKLNQLWFFSQLGETFSPAEPAIFLGKKKLAEYDKLSAGERIVEIRKELNSWEETIIILLVGSSDRFNYGSNFLPTALITGKSIDHIIMGYNGGAAVIAHELGHVWGLPHLVSNDKTAIMVVDSTGSTPALSYFPFATFAEMEKNIVRSSLRK